MTAPTVPRIRLQGAAFCFVTILLLLVQLILGESANAQAIPTSTALAAKTPRQKPTPTEFGPALEVPVQRIEAPGNLTDAGDFYLLGGRGEVHLHRATNETVLILGPAADPVRTIEAAAARLPVRALVGGAVTRLNSGRQVTVIRSTRPDSALDLQALGQSDGVLAVHPVFVDPPSRARMLPTGELIVRLTDGVPVAELEADLRAEGLELVERVGSPRLNSFLFRQLNPADDSLALARRLFAHPKLVWATPNFVREMQRYVTPNDPLFPQQQHLHNTGQQGGVVDADVDAVEAWDVSQGSSEIVIAIIDDGVDTTHPDLTIYNNPGETGSGKETNGVDDDGNGRIDDYRGWDFANGDNNPNPLGGNGHGTACSGVAAAKINNSYRSTGIAANCKILPVKIFADNGVATSDANIGAAISYAADYAHVLSNSWGGGSPSAFIDAAITDAVTNGRGGKGCPVFFANGNSASIWGRAFFPVGPNLGAGTWSFGFRFEKDGSIVDGEDLIKIDNVVLLDSDEYTHLATPLGTNGRQDFEGAFPPAGWSLSSSGGANWSLTEVQTFGGTGGIQSPRSGATAHSGWCELRTPNVVLAGDEVLTVQLYISAEAGFDGLILRVYNAVGTFIGNYGLISGVYTAFTPISYPANHPSAISVGASTDSDRRSDYSEYGPEIDFVAPSNGGWNDITTLDPSGAVGYSSSDFTTGFGGTSSATPLAAGVGALLLSVNTNLTATQVRDTMRNTAEKIGPVPYVAGFNNEYGYGRINARAALDSVAVPIITVTALDPSAAEPADTGSFRFSRTGPTAADLTVNLTVGGTATNGTDYTSLGTSVTFAVGAPTTNLTVSPINDSLVEGTETVILTVLAGSGYTVGSPSSATNLLADDDLPVITVIASDPNAAEPGDPGTITLSRTGPTTSALTVTNSLAGTATNGIDYLALTKTVTFAPGAATTNLTVVPIDDSLVEGTETVILTVLNGSGYTVGSPSSATNLLADDDLPVITVIASDPNAAEPGDPGTITLSRTGPTTSALTVTNSLAGTAANGIDYLALTNTVTFAPGAATTNLTVAPIDDSLVEGTETVIFTVLNGSGYSVGSPSSATVVIVDGDTPRVSVLATDNAASEPGNNTGRFTVARTGSTATALTIELIVDGTATSGLDYSPLLSSLTIPAGSASTDLLVFSRDDTISEEIETIIVSVKTKEGYYLGTPTTDTVELYDDDARTPSCPPGVLRLNGLSDFATRVGSLWPDSQALADYTVEAWLYQRSSGGGQFICADDAFDFDLSGDAINHVVYDSQGNFASVAKSPGPALHRWSHVAITFDQATRQMRVALDGVFGPGATFDPTAFYSDGVQNFQSFTLGARRLAPKLAVEGFFHGDMDEVRISDVVRYTGDFSPSTRLTADPNVKALYHFDEPAGAKSFNDSSGNAKTLSGLGGAHVEVIPGPDGSSLGPVAHWRFDENAGASAADASGSGNEGALANGPTWDPSGQVDGCLSFDGVDDTVVIPHSSDLELGKDNTDFSVAFWLNLQQGPTGLWRLLLQKGNGLNSRWFTFFLWPNTNRLHFRVSTTANSNEGGDSVGILATNSWNHVAMIKRGSSLRLYLNGAFDSERVLPAPVLSNQEPLYLGDNPLNFGTKAKLDELRLYCRAL
ncbi:MAG: S8 family serine peptidase, partial [Verrucomicrobiales bacterium]|nr:S8 family serine peptidase [Verrucomicrobiales bacterium]